MKKMIIITTIQPMNQAMDQFASMTDWRLVVVGDRKGPKHIDDERVHFLGIDNQSDLGYELVAKSPENHYSRKNIGYLYAISRGAETIAETDDDNYPMKGWGTDVDFELHKVETVSGVRYYNVYKAFCSDHVWPRGFPLDRILNTGKAAISKDDASIGVWQGLADRQPDVDAIYRLTLNEEICFKQREPLVLAPHVYCPFNSQNTFWKKEAYSFLYLPCTVSARFTDILRGYVAQRLLWQRGYRLAFGSPTVFQERNPHNLMRDFNDEVSMYQQVDDTVDVLESVSLTGPPLDWVVQIYQGLAERSVVKPEEIAAVKTWVSDLRRLGLE